MLKGLSLQQYEVTSLSELCQQFHMNLIQQWLKILRLSTRSSLQTTLPKARANARSCARSGGKHACVHKSEMKILRAEQC